MLDEIINNFYFGSILFVFVIVLIAYSFVFELKNKDKIYLKEYLNIKNINFEILLKYLFLSFIIRIFLEQLFTYIPFNNNDIKGPTSIFETIVEFITTCVFAPIFEEIIFRFGVYKKINKKFNIIVSIILTSIIFAVLHLYNVDGCIILIGISLIWNYVFYKTDNLIYPVLLHFFHNFYALSSNLLNYSKYWYILLIINVFGYIFLKIKKQKN